MSKAPYLLETYKSKGKFYWRLRSRKNKKIISDGAEGYASLYNVSRAALRAPLDWRKIEWSHR